ncbi:MAG: cyclic pyranopterin phosphate synthase MoaA, partial [Calditrichia bacterium]
DIIPMSRLAEQYPVEVRFIEEMPFNGTNNGNGKLKWDSRRILSQLRGVYPNLSKVEVGPFSTSVNYHIPGFRGKLGIIAGFSRTFCGTCNRIRLTAKGMIKTCLYDEGVFNLKEFMRNGADDGQIREIIRQVVANRSRDGFEVQKKRKSLHTVSESMSVIGG